LGFLRQPNLPLQDRGSRRTPFHPIKKGTTSQFRDVVRGAMPNLELSNVAF